jgi:hypothetical protein
MPTITFPLFVIQTSQPLPTNLPSASGDPNASGTGFRGWPNDYIAPGVPAGMKPDLSKLPADAASCVNSVPQTIAFNAPAPSPLPLKLTGPSSSTGDPNNDGNRRATGQVVGVVFGN